MGYDVPAFVAPDAGGSDAGLTDAGPEDAGPEDAGPADAGPIGVEFSEPTPLAGLSELTGVDDPSLTGDLLELYVNVGRDLFVSRRASVATSWEPLSPLVELNTSGFESSPEVSADGLTLHFARDDGSGASMDIWVSTRATRSEPWGAAVQITELSTPELDTNPAVSEDRLRIVFSRGSSGTARDLYEATRASIAAPFGAPRQLAALATGANEGGPMLALGGTSIVFFSDRAGGNDLYLATRATPSSPFGPPQVLAELSTAGDESDPWISEDGRYLVFARDGVLRETSR